MEPLDFQCLGCTKWFASSEGLATHRSRVHNFSRETRLYSRDDCCPCFEIDFISRLRLIHRLSYSSAGVLTMVQRSRSLWISWMRHLVARRSVKGTVFWRQTFRVSLPRASFATYRLCRIWNGVSSSISVSLSHQEQLVRVDFHVELLKLEMFNAVMRNRVTL